MDKVSGRLTVFFEEPFWVGVFERISEGKLSVCKVTFGTEPKDYEVYDFILKNYYCLRFSPAVATDVKEAGRNPKRVQREVRKQMQNTGVGTKSQQALKLQLRNLPTTRSIYSQIESGAYNIKISELIALTEIFHTDFNTIFNGLSYNK